MSRRNKNKQPAAVWLYRHTIKSAAWQALSVGARATYIELAANYNTNMKNAVYLSIRTGAKKLGVDKKTVIKWLHELQHYGIIALVQRGTIGVYGYGRASQFRLTDRPYANSPPTYDFQNWNGEIFSPQNSSPKNFPGPLEGPHRSTGRTIEKSGPASSLWSAEGTIRTDTDRSTERTITSVASSQALRAEAARLSVDAGATGLAAVLKPVAMSGLKVWTTPVLTENPYTDELRRLYRNAAPIDDGLDIPEFLRRV